MFIEKDVPPEIRLSAYTTRCIQGFGCSEENVVFAMVLIDRFLAGNTVTQYPMSGYRVVCISILIACKYLNDDIYTNKHYAQIAGIALTEFNMLELRFLVRIDFSCYTSPQTMHRYIQRFAGGREGVLLPDLALQNTPSK